MTISPLIKKNGKRVLVACLIPLTIVGILIQIDEFKFWIFDKYCVGATEVIYKSQEANALIIDYWPYSGVMEDKYYPWYLARELLEEPKQFEYLQLIYDMPRDKVVNPRCADRFIITAHSSNDLDMGLCGIRVNGELHEMTKANSIAHAPFAVHYEYGRPNIFSIRSLHFFMQNTITNEIIAEQNTFELLLGHMTKDKNRKSYGWGSAQGAIACQLTPPFKFITTVFHPMAN